MLRFSRTHKSAISRARRANPTTAKGKRPASAGDKTVFFYQPTGKTVAFWIKPAGDGAAALKKAQQFAQNLGEATAEKFEVALSPSQVSIVGKKVRLRFATSAPARLAKVCDAVDKAFTAKGYEVITQARSARTAGARKAAATKKRKAVKPPAGWTAAARRVKAKAKAKAAPSDTQFLATGSVTKASTKRKGAKSVERGMVLVGSPKRGMATAPAAGKAAARAKIQKLVTLAERGEGPEAASALKQARALGKKHGILVSPRSLPPEYKSLSKEEKYKFLVGVAKEVGIPYRGKSAQELQAAVFGVRKFNPSRRRRTVSRRRRANPKSSRRYPKLSSFFR